GMGGALAGPERRRILHGPAGGDAVPAHRRRLDHDPLRAEGAAGGGPVHGLDARLDRGRVGRFALALPDRPAGRPGSRRSRHRGGRPPLPPVRRRAGARHDTRLRAKRAFARSKWRRIMSATAGSDAQGRRIAPGFPLLATGTAAASIAFFLWRMSHSAYTPDFPWLWRAAQHILETGRLPAGDVCSWTRQGEPWVLYQWLFEVALAQGEALLGLRGLFALFTVAAIAIYLVAPLYGAVPRRVAPAFVLMPGALALAVASVNLSLRPMIVTSACLLAQYWMVQRLRRGECNLRATVLLLLPLYLLWGNMHTGVLLGLVSLGLLAAGDLAERRRIYVFEPADPAIEGRPLAWPAYLALAGAAFAASLIN